MEIFNKNNWNLRVICTGEGYDFCGCDAVLELDMYDLLILNDLESFSFSFKCPCCDKYTSINERRLPLIIKKEALLINKVNLMKEVI